MNSEWMKLVKERPIAFGIETGFTDLREIHNEWLKKFLLSKSDITLQAHRGSYKTTCLSIALALMVVVYPKQNMIFIRKADDDVKEIIMQVAKLLVSDVFQKLSIELYGEPILLLKESAFEIDTNLKSSTKGTSQLIGVGSRASLTGKHADIVITDDIINIDDRISKAHRERTKMTYQELQNIKNRTGRFINTGTPWHKQDAFSLMPNIDSYDCYSTGLINDLELQNLRQSMSPSLFAANYELKHIADADSLFDTPNYFDDESLLHDGIAHIDAAYGGGDYTAFTVGAKHGDNIYIYGDMWQKHVDDCLVRIKVKHQHLRAGSVHTENNADKGYLAKELRRLDVPTVNYHEKENKYIKISTYPRKHWSNIYFHKDTSKEYINQVLDYTENAENDDAPDSLSSIVRVLLKKSKSNTVSTINPKETINQFKKIGY